jgi:hypothetical protein
MIQKQLLNTTEYSLGVLSPVTTRHCVVDSCKVDSMRCELE